MTVMKMYCDHCGKELDGMTDYASIDVEIAHTELETDLCNACYEQLIKVVKDFCRAGRERREVNASG